MSRVPLLLQFYRYHDGQYALWHKRRQNAATIPVIKAIRLWICGFVLILALNRFLLCFVLLLRAVKDYYVERKQNLDLVKCYLGWREWWLWGSQAPSCPSACLSFSTPAQTEPCTHSNQKRLWWDQTLQPSSAITQAHQTLERLSPRAETQTLERLVTRAQMHQTWDKLDTSNQMLEQSDIRYHIIEKT